MSFIKIMFVLAVGLLASGCKGSSCESLCKEAQDRKCTSIHDDCNNYCGSVAALSKAASCQSQEDTYQSCLGGGDACTGDARCGKEKSALISCGTKYCLANPSDADCVEVSKNL